MLAPDADGDLFARLPVGTFDRLHVAGADHLHDLSGPLRGDRRPRYPRFREPEFLGLADVAHSRAPTRVPSSRDAIRSTRVSRALMPDSLDGVDGHRPRLPQG